MYSSVFCALFLLLFIERPSIRFLTFIKVSFDSQHCKFIVKCFVNYFCCYLLSSLQLVLA